MVRTALWRSSGVSELVVVFRGWDNPKYYDDRRCLVQTSWYLEARRPLEAKTKGSPRKLKVVQVVVPAVVI